ncbi:hypothetical protein CANARDRAFT_123058 [[Candida] arabinofermentans NRRL YB-2248]|uniref:Dynactin subunit 2 n=1 Tax=[Candida] arabinofermentans NRRL YB-2248 TaxID=983967 RepID=A0A1E4ST96_9ASCO|nr:hypothetical protein CANARDRAFT_123058 [[Candida] arabinofermentans NRRL YB-2248]
MLGTDYYSEDVVAGDELEIFETSDHEVVDETGNDNDDDDDDDVNNEDIVHDVFVTFDSRDTFENQIKEKYENMKFNSRYSSSSKQQQQQQETKLEKLERIRNELIELQTQDDNCDSNVTGQTRDLITLLDQLQLSSEQKIINWKNSLLQFQTPKIQPIQSEITTTPSNTDTNLFQLTSRLSKVESQIGILDEDSSISLQSSINDIHRRLNLILKPEFSLDEVTEQIQYLTEKSEEYLKNMARLDTKESIIPITDKKINKLYSKIEQLPQLEKLIKLLVSRLRSIDSIISTSSTSIDFLDSLQDEFSNINIQLSSWQDKLDIVENSIETNTQSFQTQKENIQNWIKELELKIDSL